MKHMMHKISMRLNDGQSGDCTTRRLIKDVSSIIGKGGYFEPANLKSALKRRGWDENILDYRTLELICLILEDRCG